MIPSLYTFPEPRQLSLLTKQKEAVLTLQDPIFEYMPIESEDTDQVNWEIEDDTDGMQMLRGLDNAYPRVEHSGANEYSVKPGYYGESMTLNEQYLTRARQIGSNGYVDVDSELAKMQDKLTERYVTRIKYNAYTLLFNGIMQVSNKDGTVSHVAQYEQQIYTAGTPWSTTATATPWKDISKIQETYEGYGADFGSEAHLLMNRVTLNHLLFNTNAADLGGQFTKVVTDTPSLPQINEILQKNGLPTIRLITDGYLDPAEKVGSAAAALFKRYVPDGRVLLIGKRPTEGHKVGAYKMTRYIENPGFGPGVFTDIRFSQVPPTLPTVYMGHNGGPVLQRPKSIVLIKAF